MTLKTLEEANALARKKYQRPEGLQYNGIACPNCGQELHDSDPNSTLMSNPPQKNVACDHCKYRGYRVC